MKLKELLNRVIKYHAEYGDDLIVTDGRGLSINFLDVVGVPVQGTPKPTDEQLADPNFTRPYNDVLMISTVTSTELKADACNQAYSFDYWFIELQKVFMLVDGSYAPEKEYYREDYNNGLSPADVVEKYSMGAANREDDIGGTDSGDWCHNDDRVRPEHLKLGAELFSVDLSSLFDEEIEAKAEAYHFPLCNPYKDEAERRRIRKISHS